MTTVQAAQSIAGTFISDVASLAIAALSAGQEELLAAFHQVLLVEGPRVREILEHDHDHVLRNVADGQTLGNLAGMARKARTSTACMLHRATRAAKSN
jgi:hypothetical protein